MSTRLEVPAATHHKWLATRFADKKFADARFVVIEDGEQRREFLAHKMVLASVSDVFEAMFYGNFPEEDPVKIEDTTVGAFESLLEFIYRGAVTVDVDSAFPLLNLAKKYLLGNLASLIMEHLQSSVNESNVAQLVLHGQNHLDDAPETFWRCVEVHAQALVDSEDFLLLKKSTVVDLLRRNLEIDEMVIFKRVVAWGEAECERNELPLTPVNVQSALDGVIRLVRFPLMSSKEFTLGPAKSGLLTQEEQMDLYPWFTADVTPVLFSTGIRRQHSLAYACDRFKAMSGNWYHDGSADAIDFKVDRSITITGVGVYGLYSGDTAEYKVSIELSASGHLQAKEVAMVTSKGSEPILAISFAEPLRVSADHRYTVAANITGPPTRQGVGCSAQQVVQTVKGAVAFTFSKSRMSTNGTGVEHGQLPQIMFKV